MRAGERRSTWTQDDVGGEADGIELLHHPFRRLLIGVLGLELDLHVARQRRTGDQGEEQQGGGESLEVPFVGVAWPAWTAPQLPAAVLGLSTT